MVRAINLFKYSVFFNGCFLLIDGFSSFSPNSVNVFACSITTEYCHSILSFHEKFLTQKKSLHKFVLSDLHKFPLHTFHRRSSDQRQNKFCLSSKPSKVLQYLFISFALRPRNDRVFVLVLHLTNVACSPLFNIIWLNSFLIVFNDVLIIILFLLFFEFTFLPFQLQQRTRNSIRRNIIIHWIAAIEEKSAYN